MPRSQQSHDCAASLARLQVFVNLYPIVVILHCVGEADTSSGIVSTHTIKVPKHAKTSMPDHGPTSACKWQ